MGSNALIWILAMVGYNPFSHQITSYNVVSYHDSPTACIQEKTWQNSRGRAETFNHQYVCMPVNDEMMRRQLTSNNHKGAKRFGSGARIIIEIR